MKGAGNATNQLNKPAGLAFDIKGNLYVMDMENNRVQMFELIDNRPCSSKSEGNEAMSSCSIMYLCHVFYIILASSSKYGFVK